MTATQKKMPNDFAKSVAEGAETAGDAVRATGKAAADTVRTTAEDLARTVEDRAEAGAARMGDVLRRAQDTKEAVVAGAGATLATVRDVAVEKADAARETLSDVGERIAATLQRASSETSGDATGEALRARVLSSVAEGLTRASTTLRQRSVADLASDVRGMARRHPGAFMAAAAVAGFAAARFVRASARRRMAEGSADTRQGPRL